MAADRTFRIGVAAVGLLVLLIGWFLWTMERDKSPLAFEIVVVDDGVVEVWEPGPGGEFPDRARGDADRLRAAGGFLVFTGDQAAADDYMDQRHRDADNYVIPSVAMAIGGVIVVLALIPGRKRSEEDHRLVNT
jgi:hypothetical protein